MYVEVSSRSSIRELRNVSVNVSPTNTEIQRNNSIVFVDKDMNNLKKTVLVSRSVLEV